MTDKLTSHISINYDPAQSYNADDDNDWNDASMLALEEAERLGGAFRARTGGSQSGRVCKARTGGSQPGGVCRARTGGSKSGRVCRARKVYAVLALQTPPDCDPPVLALQTPPDCGPPVLALQTLPDCDPPVLALETLPDSDPHLSGRQNIIRLHDMSDDVIS